MGDVDVAELLREIEQDAAGQSGDQEDLARQGDPRQCRLQVEEQDRPGADPCVAIRG